MRYYAGLTNRADCSNAGAMRFIEYKSGEAGVSEFISPESVAWVHKDLMPQEGGASLTVIGTLDGKEHRVQGALTDIVAILSKQ